MKNSFLAILLAMLISRKPVQEEELVWKMRLFLYSPAVTKGLKKVTNLFQIGLFPHKNLPISAQNRFVMCKRRTSNV